MWGGASKDGTETAPASPWLIGCAPWHFIPPVIPCRFAVLKVGIPSLKSPRASKSALLPPLFLPVSQSPEQGTPIPECWELGAGVPTGATEPVAPRSGLQAQEPGPSATLGCTAALLRDF